MKRNILTIVATLFLLMTCSCNWHSADPVNSCLGNNYEVNYSYYVYECTYNYFLESPAISDDNSVTPDKLSNLTSTAIPTTDFFESSRISDAINNHIRKKTQEYLRLHDAELIIHHIEPNSEHILMDENGKHCVTYKVSYSIIGDPINFYDDDTIIDIYLLIVDNNTQVT